MAVGRGQQQPLDDIVDVEAIAQLRAVAEQVDLLTVHGAAHEHRQEAQPVALQALARSVHVGEAQRGDRHAVHPGVEQVGLLAGELGDAVDVDGLGRVLLVHREVARPAVHLAGGGVHHGRRRISTPQQFEEDEMAAGVQIEVGHGIVHRGQMADLAGQVEHVPGADDRIADAIHVIDPGDDHLDVVEPGDVAHVAAVRGHQRVDHRHVGSGAVQRVHQVRADEAQASGDDAALAAEPPRRHRVLASRRADDGPAPLANAPMVRSLRSLTAPIHSG